MGRPVNCKYLKWADVGGNSDTVKCMSPNCDDSGLYDPRNNVFFSKRKISWHTETYCLRGGQGCEHFE